MRKDLYPKDPKDVKITDFFGSIRPTEVTTSRINVTRPVVETSSKSRQLTAGTVNVPPKKYVFYEQFPSQIFL